MVSEIVRKIEEELKKKYVHVRIKISYFYGIDYEVAIMNRIESQIIRMMFSEKRLNEKILEWGPDVVGKMVKEIENELDNKILEGFKK